MPPQPYQGSARQRRRQRRVRIVGVILALSLLVPIVVSTVVAFGR